MGLQPPPPPPPPPPRPLSRAAGGTEGQTSLAVDQAAAFDRAVLALQAAGCEVQWQGRPSELKFGFVVKSFGTTFGFPVSYAGDLSVTRTGPQESLVRHSLKVNWNTTVPVFLTSVGVILVAMMFNPYLAAFGLLILALSVGWSAWSLTSSVPQKASAAIQAQLRAGGAAPAPPIQPVAQPAPQPARPAPAPEPPKPPPAPEPAADSAAASDSVLDQIKKLAELRDMGAITAAEFDAKKAELLARL